MLYIVDRKPYSDNYTGEWHKYLPYFFEENGIESEVVSGNDLSLTHKESVTFDLPNESSYNVEQLPKLEQLFKKGKVRDGDKFLFVNAWHLGAVFVKNESTIRNLKVSIYGMWHTGSYDEQTFQGRLPNKEWLTYSEESLLRCYDINWVATEYHRKLISSSLNTHSCRIEVTGWPMGYLKSKLRPNTKARVKRNLIVFPHRKLQEKQLNIFLDLKNSLPEYKWLVCLDSKMSKPEYHAVMAKAKIVFSASLQETLGVSMYEGLLLDSIPMVPDRLSYSEMYSDQFKYPSFWTDSWSSYLENKAHLIERIRFLMSSYDDIQPSLKSEALLAGSFFEPTELLKYLQ